jgi:hypothetical protein
MTDQFSHLPPFQWTPLEEHWFRLIDLHPGEPGDDLIISVEVVKNRIRPFNAVSYVWGSVERIYPVYASYVTVDYSTGDFHAEKQPSGIIQVTKNLRDLLLALRSKTDYVTLWIDSICINQDDIPEKSAQVQQMRRFYELATITIIYLGEHHDLMNAAIQAIHALAEMSEWPDKEIPRILADVLPWDIKFDASKYGWTWWVHPLESAWEAFMAFLELPWFHRVWIVQEICMSRQPLLVTSGYRFQWETLLKACQVVERSKMHPMDAARVHVNIPLHLERQRQTRIEYRQATAKGEVSQGSEVATNFIQANHFITVQSRTRGCGATDPRDHIFALLGIVTGGGTSLIASLPEVDYFLTVTEVYTRMAYAWHRNGINSKPLSWLSCVNGSYHAEDLPTWVPDWRRPWNIKPIEIKFGQGASGAKGPEGCVVKFPELRTPMSLPLKLEVRGCRLSKIKYIEPVKSEDNWQNLRHSSIINQFPEPYPTTFLQYKDAFAEAVQPKIKLGMHQFKVPRQGSFWSFKRDGPHQPKLRPIYNKDIESAEKLQRTISLSFHDDAEEPNAYIMNDGDKRSEYEPKYTQHDLYKNLSSAFRTRYVIPEDGFARSRRWFITEDGFMGLTHEVSQPGDIIVHFFGGSTPYTLREKKEVDGVKVWGFVGECFVLGLMNGEVNDDMPDDSVETFTLE